MATEVRDAEIRNHRGRRLIADARIQAERQKTTVSERMRQFIALQTGWTRRTADAHDDDAAVHGRWARLREDAERQ